MLYKNFVNDTWELFNKERERKCLFLFGLNHAAFIIKEMFRYGVEWSVEAILDNDEKKWGKINVWDRTYKVESPNCILNYDKDEVVILLCGSYCGEMAIQLEKMGVHNYFSNVWMESPIVSRRPYEQVVDPTLVNKLKSIVNDEKSRQIIDAIVEKRRYGFIDYSDIMERGSEYFIDEFWQPYSGGIFVDGGAYDGDTIEEIDNWTKGNFKKIYSFEPQVDKAEKIESKLWKYNDRVVLFRNGLWNCKESIHFKSGNSEVSGSINDNGDAIIETISLDEVVDDDEKVTFIKMDIEGAEMKALEGAKKVITRDKPDMAICIYHKLDDLWQIPFFIKEMMPGYILSIRHFGLSQNGTILYARMKS